MKRTTLSLPDDLAVALERDARRRSASMSEVAREALRAYLQPSGDRLRELPFAGLSRRHVARDAEDILAAEWRHPGDR